MKIAIAADHGGVAYKEHLKASLLKQGYEIKDFGTESTESCDYPDFGIPAAEAVVKKEVERSILICTNGIGMSMLANKVDGVRAALVYSESSAEKTRLHHDSNVLCLGAGEFGDDKLDRFVELWLTTGFEGGRHLRRINKFQKLKS